MPLLKIILLCSFFSCTTLIAQDSAQFYKANSLVKEGQYAQATELYEQLIAKSYYNGHLYYNLGYCYFRQGKIGRAIANYKKALILMPRDSDVRANLRYAQAKTLDKVATAPVSVTHYLLEWVSWFNLNERLWLASVILGLAFLLNGLRRLSTSIDDLLKIPARLFVVSFVVFGLAASTWYFSFENFEEGVIITKEASVKSGAGIDDVTLFTLHEGGEINIVDENAKWLKIALKDGKRGWIPKKFVARVSL